jgi:hypothetical protein
MNLPLSKENIILFPFQYLETEKKKYNNQIKKKNSLIVFGQGGITESIADKIISNINYFQKYNIIFKLHPNEYHMI